MSDTLGDRIINLKNRKKSNQIKYRKPEIRLSWISPHSLSKVAKCIKFLLIKHLIHYIDSWRYFQAKGSSDLIPRTN